MNCGTVHFPSWPDIPVERPAGRLDPAIHAGTLPRQMAGQRAVWEQIACRPYPKAGLFLKLFLDIHPLCMFLLRS
jgi:hypothetical protein